MLTKTPGMLRSNFKITCLVTNWWKSSSYTMSIFRRNKEILTYIVDVKKICFKVPIKNTPLFKRHRTKCNFYAYINATATITFVNPQWEDAGLYFCRTLSVFNRSKKQSKTIHLEFLGECKSVH